MCTLAIYFVWKCIYLIKPVFVGSNAGSTRYFLSEPFFQNRLRFALSVNNSHGPLAYKLIQAESIGNLTIIAKTIHVYSHCKKYAHTFEVT